MAAWVGHGNLAFVSAGQLEVVSNAGVVGHVSGPNAGGYDSNPQWSSDGQWLAFLNTPAPPTPSDPAPTLWLVNAGSSVAAEVTTKPIGMFAWSPTEDVLAYTVVSADNSTFVYQNLWIDRPGKLPVSLAIGQYSSVNDVAWSPTGDQLAFDGYAAVTPHVAGAPGSSPRGIGIISVLGGPVASPLQLAPGDEAILAGWWPTGNGLLFWEDPGAANPSDGESFYSLALGTAQPVEIGSSLIGSSWWASAPGQDTIAFVSTGSGFPRSIWSSGRNVMVCSLETTGSCAAQSIPPGTEALAPSWSDAGALMFVTASVSGPFGWSGSADWTPGWVAEWDRTNQLWTSDDGGAPEQLNNSPAGSVLAESAMRSPTMLVVADDELWLVNLAQNARPTMIAGPLFSSSAPTGFYGEVDWAGTFGWSAAAGPRSGSAESFDESGEAGSEVP